MNKIFLSTTEVAKILGISRVAVFRKIKKGDIKATKVGRNYVIAKRDLDSIFKLKKTLTKKEEEELDIAIEKTFREYGETLRLLGKE